jgi:hypothetical protein
LADIVVSYTSDDRDRAFWTGQELLKLGHAARMRGANYRIERIGRDNECDTGQTHQQTLDDFPELTEDDIGACPVIGAH